MTLRPIALSLAASLCLALFAACSSDSEPAEGNQNTGGGSGTGGSKGTPPVRPPPAYECSAHKWMNVSDACWSCICDACGTQLNACDTSCTDIFECAHEKGTLVNVGTEINCEIRATFAECIGSDTARQGAAQALVTFDTCLITKGSAGSFRICDAECATPYPGDVCARYPQ